MRNVRLQVIALILIAIGLVALTRQLRPTTPHADEIGLLSATSATDSSDAEPSQTTSREAAYTSTIPPDSDAGESVATVSNTTVPNATVSKTTAGIAVVELFTSQGCSSCPPADERLRELIAEASRTDRPIFCLSFHVHYWNHLGWHDPFSDPLYSARQRGYARAFRLNGPYTPQMVINGTDQFVGSDRSRIDRGLDRAFSTPATTEVRLTLRSFDFGKIEPAASHDAANVSDRRFVVDYEVTPMSQLTQYSVLNIAAVERSVQRSVPRGENAGKSLSHANVVRNFKVVPLIASGQGTVRLNINVSSPPGPTATVGAQRVLEGLPSETKTADIDSPGKNFLLIAYVQDLRTLKISGATSVGLDGR